MSTINNNTSMPVQLPLAPSNFPVIEKATQGFQSSVQQANSSEEKAIAASTTLSKELGKGNKKTGTDEANQLKRLKLLEKITSLNKLNLSGPQVEAKAAELRSQLKSGGALIKDVLDSQGGETVLLFAALKKINSQEKEGSELGEAAKKYLDVILVHKNKTITSWVNTSDTIADNVTDKDLAFEIQSMLAVASESNVTPRGFLRAIIDIGGQDRCEHVKDSSIKALAADIRSHASSADLATLSKNLSMLNNIYSVASMYKQADEELKKLFTGGGTPSLTSSDFLEISLDISLNLEPAAITSYSIALLGSSPQDEYKFSESLLSAFKGFPLPVWNDSNERQAAIEYVSKVMFGLSDPTGHAEISVKDTLLQRS